MKDAPVSGYRFSLYVNQQMAIKLGIENLNQAVVFDLLANASSWAKPIVNPEDNEVYYWVARQSVCSQLPFLKLKPDTVYRHYRKLLELGLIDYLKIGIKDCVRTTNLGKSYLLTMSEINPSYLGNKSESDSEINPTYKTTKTDINIKDKKGAHAFSDQMEKYGVDQKFIDEILKHRREIKSKKPTPKAMNLILLGMSRAVEQGLMSSMTDCLEYFTTETTWQSFKPEYLPKVAHKHQGGQDYDAVLDGVLGTGNPVEINPRLEEHRNG